MALKFNTCTLTFSFILYIFSFFSYSQNLYWAGFAFIGNKDQNFRYPVATEIFEQNNRILSSTLKQTLSSIKRKDINFIFESGKISKGDAKAVAFALADESIERTLDKFGVTTKYTIYGQVLIFDFIENKVLANYPVVAISAVTSKEMPSEKKDKDILKTMYLDISDEASIFSQFAKMFENVRVKESASIATIGVRDVIFNEKALQGMPERLKKNGVFKSKIAQELESSIASFHNVPLIPFTIGEALGSKGSAGLATRFDDNVSKELTLPEKDYAFDIIVRGFIKKEQASDAQVQHLWAGFIELKLLGFENSVIFSQKFRHVEEAVFSRVSEAKILDDWILNEIVIANLLIGVTEQIKIKDVEKLSKFVKTGTDVKEIIKNFDKIEEKFAQCL